MNTSSKKFRNIFLGVILLIACLLTFITLKIQQKHTQDNFKSDLAEIAKKSENSSNEQKTSKNDTSKNSSKIYMIPETNQYANDRQAIKEPKYDNQIEKVSLPYMDTYGIKSFRDVPSKGVVLVFLYKDNVESAKDYEPVIKEVLSETQNKVSIKIININSYDDSQGDFYNFYTKHTAKTPPSLPEAQDLYMLAISDNVVLDMITKTDTSKNSFNSKNVLNIISSVEKYRGDVNE